MATGDLHTSSLLVVVLSEPTLLPGVALEDGGQHGVEDGPHAGSGRWRR